MTKQAQKYQGFPAKFPANSSRESCPIHFSDKSTLSPLYTAACGIWLDRQTVSGKSNRPHCPHLSPAVVLGLGSLETVWNEQREARGGVTICVKYLPEPCSPSSARASWCSKTSPCLFLVLFSSPSLRCHDWLQQQCYLSWLILEAFAETSWEIMVAINRVIAIKMEEVV